MKSENNDSMRQNILRVGAHVFHTDGEGALTSYEGPGGEVKVPEGLHAIDAEAFAFCGQVTGVKLPEGIQWIEKRAFFGSGIRTISLPESLIKIGELAFSGTLLESIEIPDQVREVKERAFLDAKNLKKVKLPKRITSLEPSVFMGCASLKEIIVPKNVKNIEGRAFALCTGLERVSLPEGLVSVWREAFRGCCSLREIRLGDNVEAVGYAAFKDCTALEKVRIPKDLHMTWGNAFEDSDRLVLTGPGREAGIIVDSDDVRYIPASGKLIVPNGVKEFPSTAPDGLRIEILDLPRSLKFYSWSSFADMKSLRQIVTDRDALAAEIALLLDVECVDRDGQRFTFQVPEREGRWLVERDKERNGVRLMGCRGRIGHTGSAEYTTVVIPDVIKGKTVTSIGAGAFDGCGTADAFYIPDSVQHIGSRAFGNNRYCVHGWKLFLRMPRHAVIAEDAFEGTEFFTRNSVYEETRPEEAKEASKSAAAALEEKPQNAYAAAAADDPTIGTGIHGRPELMPNVWQYLDRMSREQRIQELTHSFAARGRIDGAGWATVKISLDGDEARFRISYVGRSPDDFKSFAAEVEDGESSSFGWESEPGWYPWKIQRRGGILYVSAPRIEKCFFISREEFLLSISGLTGSW